MDKVHSLHCIKMGADSLSENTPNASINFSPICLPKPKSLGYLKKSSLWVSVVRYCVRIEVLQNCSAIFVSFLVRGYLRELRFFHKIRILVVPLLKTLYSADERNNHHTYMSLIILLILSEDEFFNGMYLVFLHFVIRPTKCNECFPENR